MKRGSRCPSMEQPRQDDWLSKEDEQLLSKLEDFVGVKEEIEAPLKKALLEIGLMIFPVGSTVKFSKPGLFMSRGNSRGAREGRVLEVYVENCVNWALPEQTKILVRIQAITDKGHDVKNGVLYFQYSPCSYDYGSDKTSAEVFSMLLADRNAYQDGNGAARAALSQQDTKP